MQVVTPRQVVQDIILILLVVCAVYNSVTYAEDQMYGYVRGEDGDTCSLRGEEHGNVKNPLYYPTYEACKESKKK
jgi:hypothetical protein